MTLDPVMDGVELRRATAADAAEIAELYLASFKATYDFPLAHSADQVRRWITEILLPTHEVWVAADAEGSIVGMMALSAEMLAQLYVAPGQTGRGIGSRLVELAKHRRPAGLDLYTFQINSNARRFYERRGFSQVWLGDGSTNEEGQPDVRYAWRDEVVPMAGANKALDTDRRGLPLTS
jgi:GNAT superfamily N-acetyltransferase